MNRVLTWDEVLELRDGDRVWVEHAENTPYYDEVHTAERWKASDGKEDIEGVSLLDRAGDRWHVEAQYAGAYNRIWRAWELPLMPTDEERKNAPEWGAEVE